jgi:hypothetical protein
MFIASEVKQFYEMAASLRSSQQLLFRGLTTNEYLFKIPFLCVLCVLCVLCGKNLRIFFQGFYSR